MKMLDLTRAKVEYMPVKLDHVGELHISTPTKESYEALIAYLPRLAVLDSVDPNTSIYELEGEAKEAVIALYDVLSAIISVNRERITVDAEELADILPIEYAIVFMNAYTQFIAEVRAGREKN